MLVIMPRLLLIFPLRLPDSSSFFTPVPPLWFDMLESEAQARLQSCQRVLLLEMPRKTTILMLPLALSLLLYMLLMAI